MRDHEAVTLTAPSGEAVEIDVKIVPVIELLWRHGIGTRWSCEGGEGAFGKLVGLSGGFGYVVLADPADMARAVELLAGTDLRNVRTRLLHKSQRERRDKLRRGESVTRLDVPPTPQLPGELVEDWVTRVRAVVKQAPSVELTPAERAAEIAVLDEQEAHPSTIDFDPVT